MDAGVSTQHIEARISACPRAWSPFEAQTQVAAAIRGYVTQSEVELAHANCMRMLELRQTTHDENVFLQSCIVALRHRLSFDFPLRSSIPPNGVKAAPALHREAAERSSL